MIVEKNASFIFCWLKPNLPLIETGFFLRLSVLGIRTISEDRHGDQRALKRQRSIHTFTLKENGTCSHQSRGATYARRMRECNRFVLRPRDPSSWLSVRILIANDSGKIFGLWAAFKVRDANEMCNVFWIASSSFRLVGFDPVRRSREEIEI